MCMPYWPITTNIPSKCPHARKVLDLLAHDVDTSLVGGVELHRSQVGSNDVERGSPGQGARTGERVCVCEYQGRLMTRALHDVTSGIAGHLDRRPGRPIAALTSSTLFL